MFVHLVFLQQPTELSVHLVDAYAIGRYALPAAHHQLIDLDWTGARTWKDGSELHVLYHLTNEQQTKYFENK